MTVKKGQTGIEDVEDVIARFVRDAEALKSTVSSPAWKSYVTDVLGINYGLTADRQSFFNFVRNAVSSELGITTELIAKTGQIVFRVPTGQPGAGQFMSKADVSSKIANYKLAKGK